MESYNRCSFVSAFFCSTYFWTSFILLHVPITCSFFFHFISWGLITLQYCSGFCHTLTWISHGFTCVPHPEPLSDLPPHPIPLARVGCSERIALKQVYCQGWNRSPAQVGCTRQACSFLLLAVLYHVGFPGGSVVKNLPANAGNVGLIPESPGEMNGYPLQYSCLENSMDRGAW